MIRQPGLELFSLRAARIEPISRIQAILEDEGQLNRFHRRIDIRDKTGKLLLAATF